MRKWIGIMVFVTLSLAIAATATAQVRGRGRLQGAVTDKATGKPVSDATVTISPAGEKTQPIIARTDAKGHWSALGLTTGNGHIDITANGYDMSQGSAAMSELPMATPIKPE